MYRLDKFCRLVWDAEGRYIQNITPAHGDAWLERLQDREISESDKASCLKDLLTLFNWKADR